jgi:hypothetical protein
VANEVKKEMKNKIIGFPERSHILRKSLKM